MDETKATITWIDGYLKGAADAAPRDNKRILNAVFFDSDSNDVAAAYQSFLTNNPDIEKFGLTQPAVQLTEAQSLSNWIEEVSKSLATVFFDLSEAHLRRIEWQVTEMLVAESIDADNKRRLQSDAVVGGAEGRCFFFEVSKGSYLVLSALLERDVSCT